MNSFDRKRRFFALALVPSVLVLASAAARAQPVVEMPEEQTQTGSGNAIETVVVTAARTSLLGVALTSSQGVVTASEMKLTPAYRVGQMLETIPGLVVTAHSGEGKANQYLMRGFNLDHGTDLATFVADMPVNQRTHAHGQGYTDLNFIIPELITGVTYTKGPYYASEGDFSSVGSDHIDYLDMIPNQMKATVGTMGYESLFGAGSVQIGDNWLLGALSLEHYDGPWTHSDNFRKIAGALRYSGGTMTTAYSVMAMFYRGLWNATTDQPERAMKPAYMTGLGLQPIGYYSSLDPSDGGQKQRMSLSGELDITPDENREIKANAFFINSQLTLWNNFTHYLMDPVNGDQEAQHEVRDKMGGAASYGLTDVDLLGAKHDFLVGIDTRYDIIHVDHIHTKDRVPLAVLENDNVDEGSAGLYGQVTSHWTEWFRSVLGLREDYISGHDTGSNAGNVHQALFEPKGSLIFDPWKEVEIYVSAGRGFHSNDVRGAVQPGGTLIARSTGEEVGLRMTPWPNFTATATLFKIDFSSETTYNPDIGQDEAGPPSKRYGVELNLTYQAFKWLEFYGSVAATHARYTIVQDDGFGHLGTYIPDAPVAVGQLGIYLRNLDHWSGGLELRYFGQHPLVPDNSIHDDGYADVNLDVEYELDNGWQLGGGIYNLFNTRAHAAAYYYGDRVSPTEPVADPATGIGDVHIHPLEPISFRFSVTKTL